MLHFKAKRLPLLIGEKRLCSLGSICSWPWMIYRELYAAIQPDKTQQSAARFLAQVIEERPYTIECAYSDNGTKYKGTPEHNFVSRCQANGTGQQLARVRPPQTNDKVKRVINTLLEMWHATMVFVCREHRQWELTRFINFYNTVKPHAAIANMTPYAKLTQ